MTPTPEALDALAARLRADDLLHNRGPNYEPLRIPASPLRLEAADAIEALRSQVEAPIADVAALRKDLQHRACDPGAFVGYKGDRSLGEWMGDALGQAAAAIVAQLTAATSRAMAAETALAEAREALKPLVEMAEAQGRFWRTHQRAAKEREDKTHFAVKAEPWEDAARIARAALEPGR